MTELIITLSTTIASVIGTVIVCILNNRAQMKKLAIELEARHNAEREEESRALRNGVQCILRDRLLQLGKEYCEVEKWCSPNNKTNVDKMYKAYHALGGNDIATGIRERILSLPDYPQNN